MILWLALFLLIVAISFLLSLRSMKDFAEVPQNSKLEYSLFLIRKSPNLTVSLLQSIHDDLASKNLIASIERLFKGSESALCLFGPKEMLENYLSALDLVELEDYTQTLTSSDTTVWEVGGRGVQPFKNFPSLEVDELFMWQILFLGKHMQIRAGVSSKQSERRRLLAKDLQSLAEGKLVKLPRPFSNDVMLEAYKQRSIDKEVKQYNAETLLSLLRI